MVSAECVSNEHGSYLAITVHGDSLGGRVGNIGGDLMLNNEVRPEWGLHLIDVNVALGNLLDIVGQQAESYQSRSTTEQ